MEEIEREANDVLVIIPARGGSKGIPGKNTRVIFNKPLLTHAYDCAKKLNSYFCVDIVLSTDCPDIAKLGASIGLEVPFLRPASLAQDDTPMIDVIEHMVDFFVAQGKEYNCIVLLQPTSPFRKASDVKSALSVLNENENIDSVVSVEEIPKQFSPFYLMKIEQGALLPFMPDGYKYARRQDVPSAYSRNGQFYVFRTKTLKNYRSIYGNKVMPYITRHPAVNLDTAEDWDQAERLYEQFFEVTQ